MREDVSGRFDYQFETRWSRRIVHAGVALATLATATAVTPNVSQPVPTPTQPPSTVASEPPSTMPPPPTTRAPISLSPESRAPFRTRRRPGRTTRVAGYSSERFNRRATQQSASQQQHSIRCAATGQSR